MARPPYARPVQPKKRDEPPDTPLKDSPGTGAYLAAPASPPAPTSPHLLSAVLAGAFAICGAFYFWSARDEKAGFAFSRAPVTYYAHLAESFLHGQLSLRIQPRPELLALPNPYDPEANLPYRLHDASLYGYRYYLYFGAPPALLLHLPLFVLTGFYPSDAFAAAIFIVVGIGFWLSSLHVAVSHWFRHIRSRWVFLSALTLGFCHAGPFVVARPAVYEVCLAAAYCFAAALFYFLLRAFTVGLSGGTLAAAAGALGLAIATRPTAVVVVPVMAAALLWKLHRDRVPASRWIGLLFPSVALLSLTAALMAAYNYARFDSVAEFGTKYVLAGTNMQQLKLFSANRIPTGLYLYLFSAPQITDQFPFLWAGAQPPAELRPRPPYFVEPVAGVFAIHPICLVLCVLPFLWRMNDGKNPDIQLAMLALLASGIAEVFLLSCWVGATMRYELEFGPPLCSTAVLATCIAVSNVHTTHLARIGLASAMGFGIFAGCILSLSGYYFDRRHPTVVGYLRTRSVSIVSAVLDGGFRTMKTSEPQPAAYWSADGTAADAFSGYDGTLLNGATFAAGKVNQAFRFDGKASYIQIRGHETVRGPRSIAAWLFATGAGYLGMPIFTGGTREAGDFFGIINNHPYIDHWGSPIYVSKLSLAPNAWNHVAVTYDGSSIRFYVNGVAGDPIRGSLYDYPMRTCMIGGNRIGGSTTRPSFDGLLDEIRLYSRVMTTPEIIALAHP